MAVSDFFPENVYARILEYNPFLLNRGRDWIAPGAMKKLRQSTPYDRRKQIDFATEDFTAPVAAKEFWSTLASAMLEDDCFARQVRRVYPAYFDLRFGEAMLDDAFFSRLKRMLFVQRHEPDYSIGPHTDSPHRVFTCIFAFADGSGFEQYGTQFVRPRDPDVRCWGDLHHSPNEFEVVEVAPYAPNSMVLFFKTRHSFHSVRTIPNNLPNERYGMQLGYYEPSDGLFRDLSRPDLMEKRGGRPLFERRILGKSIVIRVS